jgi:hypothetical protein
VCLKYTARIARRLGNVPVEVRREVTNASSRRCRRPIPGTQHRDERLGERRVGDGADVAGVGVGPGGQQAGPHLGGCVQVKIGLAEFDLEDAILGSGIGELEAMATRDTEEHHLAPSWGDFIVTALNVGDHVLPQL